MCESGGARKGKEKESPRSEQRGHGGNGECWAGAKLVEWDKLAVWKIQS
jgi:hypothetical protein